MLALALVLEGRGRAEAAMVCGMSRQTSRDGVHRYDAAGRAGLSDTSGRTGTKPKLSPEQEARVADHGVMRWRPR